MHLLLIDASGIAFRAFATSDPVHRASDGEPIGATLRFMDITWRMLGAAEVDKPTHGAAVFDIPGPNFRHKLYPAYKSNRDPARRLILDGQMPWMKHAADSMGLFPIEAEGFEADDVIATLSHLATKAGIRTTIVSSDKDFGQLVVDGSVEIVDPMQKRRSLAKDVEAKFGVPPRLVTSLQALAGDSVDGYPGIPGCGMKRAAELLRGYGSIPGIFKNLDRIPWPGLRHALKRKDAADLVAMYKKLARLRTDVPTDPDILEKMAMKPVMRQHLEAILKAIEAPTWAMQSIFRVDEQHMRLVPTPAGDPLAWWREEMKFGPQPLPDLPQAGYYKRRLVLGGAEVPAKIWLEPSNMPGHSYLRCMVDGNARDPFSEWARLSQQPIPLKTFEFMVADSAHAKKWRPGDPKATPSKATDRSKQPFSTNPRRRQS